MNLILERVAVGRKAIVARFSQYSSSVQQMRRWFQRLRLSRFLELALVCVVAVIVPLSSLGVVASLLLAEVLDGFTGTAVALLRVHMVHEN